MYKWMWKLADEHSEIVGRLILGKSYEGRELRGLRLFPGLDKPIVLIEGGIHADEWIATSTALYFIYKLLRSPKGVVISYEWHIFPTVNPDGYDYALKKNRTWRKTRSQTVKGLYGVDANRNWDYAWSEGGPTSRIPHSRIYPGRVPFSEAETRALATHVIRNLSRLWVYVALHCSRQAILIPWGCTKTPAQDHDQLIVVAEKAAAAFGDTNGYYPKAGPISTTLYLAPGNSVDWIYSKGIKFCFALELRHLKRGLRFHEPGEITPSGEETFNAVVVMLEEALPEYKPGIAKIEERQVENSLQSVPSTRASGLEVAQHHPVVRPTSSRTASRHLRRRKITTTERTDNAEGGIVVQNQEWRCVPRRRKLVDKLRSQLTAALFRETAVLDQ